jgi:pterin-4a-carbinolamine dehydratase
VTQLETRIPAKVKQWVGVSAQTIKPLSELETLKGKDFDLAKSQVPGWKVVDSSHGQSIRQEWKGKDAASASQIAQQLGEVVEASGHKPVGVRVDGDVVTVELATVSLGEV